MTTDIAAEWTRPEILKELQSEFRGKIVREGEPGYDEAPYSTAWSIRRRSPSAPARRT
jgi:hypothetical protein